MSTFTLSIFDLDHINVHVIHLVILCGHQFCVMLHFLILNVLWSEFCEDALFTLLIFNLYTCVCRCEISVLSHDIANYLPIIFNFCKWKSYSRTGVRGVTIYFLLQVRRDMLRVIPKAVQVQLFGTHCLFGAYLNDLKPTTFCMYWTLKNMCSL